METSIQLFRRCVWKCDAIYTIPLEFLEYIFFRLKFKMFCAKSDVFFKTFKSQFAQIVHPYNGRQSVFRCIFLFSDFAAVQISLISFLSMKIIAKCAVNFALAFENGSNA